MAYQKEIEKLEQRYAENPKQWFAALADAYRKQGELDLAIEYVKGGIEQRPDYASAYIVLGRCYLDKEMDEEAARAFEQVLELDVENIIALRSLAEIAERKGDAAGARSWLDRLLEVDPMNEEALESLDRLGTATEAAPEPEPVPAEQLDEEMTPQAGIEGQRAESDVAADEDVYTEAAAAGSIDLEPTSIGSSDADVDTGVSQVSGDIGTVDLEEGPGDTIEPIELETPMPGDLGQTLDEASIAEDQATAEIEPIEFETPMPGDLGETPDEASIAEDQPTAEIEPIELEREGEGTGALLGEEPPSAEIGSFEVETEDSGMSSLLGDAPPEPEEAPMAGIESIELEPADSGAGLFEPGVTDEEYIEQAPALDESTGEIEETEDEAELEPVEGESADLDGEDVAEVEISETRGVEDVAEAEISDTRGEEDVAEAEISETRGEEDVAEVEISETRGVEDVAEAEISDTRDEEDVAEAEISDTRDEEDATFERGSIPPTDEVAAVDIEALRAADEMVARPTVDTDVAGEEWVESLSTAEPDAEEAMVASGEPAEEVPDEVAPTAEIDAVELERLRSEDVAFATESTGESEVLEPDGAEAAAEASDEPVEAAEAAEPPLPLIIPEEDEAAEATPDTEPEPVVTETMAEVYAKQGLLDQAREIYEVLVMQHGDDERLKGRLDELNEQAENALQETRQSRFSVSATGGESAVSYLQRLFSGGPAGPSGSDAAESTPAAEPQSEVGPELTPLEQAFSEDPSQGPGAPTVPADDEVSLASVFDGSPPGVSSGGSPDEQEGDSEEEGGVSYDEFYGTDSSGSSPDIDDDEGADDDAEEDDDFKNWLDGLKT